MAINRKQRDSTFSNNKNKNNNNKVESITGRRRRPRRVDTESQTFLDSKPSGRGGDSADEMTWSILKEVMPAFLLAGLGNIAASYYLAKVQSWRVFQSIPQLVILVPSLLGLKGNVEMTLASRLSTHANLGDLDSKSCCRKIIMGNMALIQCQASAVGFIAPLLALMLSAVSHERIDLSFEEVILLITSSVITANIANLLLGSLMIVVVFLSRRLSINPDNIATPIAASLGDVTTMILLSNISNFIYLTLDSSHDYNWLHKTLLIGLMSLIPIWAYVARTNPFTKSVIVTGWFPVCGAMLIQNIGGVVMERALSRFSKIASLQLLVNGAGGNLVSIQSSRMSTYLHQRSTPKKLPKSNVQLCDLFRSSVFVSSTSPHTRIARLLMMLSIPSHIIFLIVIEIVNRSFVFTPSFVTIYLLVAVLHVVVLIHLAYGFVHWLWKIGSDPDNSAIPFLTAFADLMGSLLLATAFMILYLIRYENVYSHHS